MRIRAPGVAENAEAAPHAAAARTSSSTASPRRAAFTRQGMSMPAFLAVGAVLVCLIPVLRLLGVPALILVGGDWAPQLRQAESRHCSADVISERMLAAKQQLNFAAAVFSLAAGLSMAAMAVLAGQRQHAANLQRALLAAGAFCFVGWCHGLASAPEYLDIHIAATAESARCLRGVRASHITRYFFQAVLIWRCLGSVLEVSQARLRSMRRALSDFTQARLMNNAQPAADRYVVKEDSGAGLFAPPRAARPAADFTPFASPAPAHPASHQHASASAAPSALGVQAPTPSHTLPEQLSPFDMRDMLDVDSSEFVFTWRSLAKLCLVEFLTFFARYCPAIVPLDCPGRFFAALWQHRWWPTPATFSSLLLSSTPLLPFVVLTIWLSSLPAVVFLGSQSRERRHHLAESAESGPLPPGVHASGDADVDFTSDAGAGAGAGAGCNTSAPRSIQGTPPEPAVLQDPASVRQERITRYLELFVVVGAHTLHVLEPTFALFGEGRVGIALQALLVVAELFGLVVAPALSVAHAVLANEELEVLQLYQQNAIALERAATEEEANKAKRRLLRYVMHEVRVPLHSLQLGIGELESRYQMRACNKYHRVRSRSASASSKGSAGGRASVALADSTASENAHVGPVAGSTIDRDSSEQAAAASAGASASAAPVASQLCPANRASRLRVNTNAAVLGPAPVPASDIAPPRRAHSPLAPAAHAAGSTPSPKSFLVRSLRQASLQPNNTGDLGSEQEEAETLAVMSGATEQMAEILNSVLTLSALEAGQLTLDPQPYSIATAIRNVVARMRPWAASAAVRAQLEVRVEPRLDGLEFSFDKLRVTQVLSNFVSNALKAVTDMQKRSVLVSVFGIGHSVYNDSDDEQGQGSNCTVPARVRVEVADTGSGVPVAERPKLFKPFMQVAGCGKSTQSSGLGLAISREIVTRHGGTIGYQPAPNRPEKGKDRQSQQQQPAGGPASILADRTMPDRRSGCDCGGSIFWFELPVLHGRVRTVSNDQNNSNAAAHASAQLPQQQDGASATANLGADATHDSVQPSQPQQQVEASQPQQPRSVQRATDHQRVQPSDLVPILVVDDVPSARRLLIRALQRGEWHIRGKAVQFAEAGTGEQAVAAVAEAAATGAPFAAVLMDAVMPGCGGYEATATLRQSGYRGAIFGVTGNALEEDQQRFRDAGADAVLTKPVDVAAIRIALEKALR